MRCHDVDSGLIGKENDVNTRRKVMLMLLKN